MSAISVNHLGKKYKRFPNHWARFGELVTGGLYRRHQERWALRGISFQVRPDEAIGIIGQNGSGKSTLLKILTGTTLQTEGTYHLSGRIAALLELGLGFHADFTGRENAIMSCRMMGLTKEESEAVIPEIIDFSELGDYIDQPLRVYSTGMQMRLAFSSATAVRPDILIIDEALAVGDAYFQHKCMKRIRSFKKQKTTLLFVSHDAASIKSLCDRAILLNEGSMVHDGQPDVVLDYYNGMIAKKSKDEQIRQVENDFGKITTRSGTGQARIVEVEMMDEEGRPARAYQVNDKAKIRCRIKFYDTINNPTFGFIIRDRMGNDVFGTNTHHMDLKGDSFVPGDEIEIVFTVELQIGYGNYSVCTAVHEGSVHVENSYDWWDQCLVFEMIPNNSYHFIGCAALLVHTEYRRRQSSGKSPGS
ncbi:ABC transporter ATP-binding protein [Candidatus Parcubacteria bacterium]|nr:MAG: ABC transporter ATP-binding protein [Candidatus Parcubacteria bacterium]